jgi:hypothetical protein
MDFYAGNMSLLNDIAQIENDAGPSGSEAAARPEDTHRSTQTQMALFGLRARLSAGLLGNRRGGNLIGKAA